MSKKTIIGRKYFNLEIKIKGESKSLYNKNFKFEEYNRDIKKTDSMLYMVDELKTLITKELKKLSSKSAWSWYDSVVFASEYYDDDEIDSEIHEYKNFHNSEYKDLEVNLTELNGGEINNRLVGSFIINTNEHKFTEALDKTQVTKRISQVINNNLEEFNEEY